MSAPEAAAPSGKRSRKVAPAPGALSTAIVPPIASAKRRATQRPIPNPPRWPRAMTPSPINPTRIGIVPVNPSTLAFARARRTTR